jgi:hypothetical protein
VGSVCIHQEPHVECSVPCTPLVMTENSTRPYTFGICTASNACKWWWISSVGGDRVNRRFKKKMRTVCGDCRDYKSVFETIRTLQKQQQVLEDQITDQGYEVKQLTTHQTTLQNTLETERKNFATEVCFMLSFRYICFLSRYVCMFSFRFFINAESLCDSFTSAPSSAVYVVIAVPIYLAI